jgi:FkbM family methyltransferase
MTATRPAIPPATSPARKPGKSILRSLRLRLDERRAFSDESSWLRFSWLNAVVSPRAMPVAHPGVALCVRGENSPTFIRPVRTDIRAFKEVVLAGQYDHVREVVAPDARVVLDLGANIGLTLRRWRRLFPTSTIVGVEPDAQNVRLCALNTRGDARTTVVPACVGATRRSVVLDARGGPGEFKMTETVGNGAASIEAITVDDVLARAGVSSATPIDLLKCDIEGAEAEVFAAGGAWLSRVGAIAIEIHGPYTLNKLLEDLDRHAPGRFTVHHLEQIREDLCVAVLKSGPTQGS